MAFRYFTPNFRDVLTGTAKHDRFVVNEIRDAFNENQPFVDKITRYGKGDWIDLPGYFTPIRRWRDGSLRPMYRQRNGPLDYSRAQVIRPGTIGLIDKSLGKTGPRHFVLIANLGQPQIFTNEDIVIDIFTDPGVKGVFII